MAQLARNLPPRTIGYPWTLAFGTSKHGMSIKTLYRAMQGQDTPVLMVIKDSDGQVTPQVISSILESCAVSYNPLKDPTLSKYVMCACVCV